MQKLSWGLNVILFVIIVGLYIDRERQLERVEKAEKMWSSSLPKVDSSLFYKIDSLHGRSRELRRSYDSLLKLQPRYRYVREQYSVRQMDSIVFHFIERGLSGECSEDSSDARHHL